MVSSGPQAARHVRHRLPRTGPEQRGFPLQRLNQGGGMAQTAVIRCLHTDGTYMKVRTPPPPPPAPHSSRLRGVPMHLPYPGTPLISGKLTDHFTRLFHMISTPFLGNISHLNPISQEHYGHPNLLLFRAQEIYVGRLLLPSEGGGGGATTDIQYNKGPTAIFSEAIEGSGKHTYKCDTPS